MSDPTKSPQVERNTAATLAPGAWVLGRRRPPAQLWEGMPAADVFEEGDTVVVKIEVPGLKKEEIDVEAAGDVVTISGKRDKEEKIAKKDYYRCERAAGAFRRSVALPFEVEPGKTTAQLRDGVLEVRARKKGDARKAKKIEVA